MVILYMMISHWNVGVSISNWRSNGDNAGRLFMINGSMVATNQLPAHELAPGPCCQWMGVTDG